LGKEDLKEDLMGSSATPSYQTQNSSSTSTSGPHPRVMPFLKDVFGNYEGWAHANMAAPEWFPNGTVADRSGMTTDAIAALNQRGIAGSPVVGSAKGSLTDTLAGKYLDPTSDPNFVRGIEASMRPQTEQLLGEILPTLDAKFAGAGRPGGGLHGATSLKLVNDLQRSQSDAIAKAVSDRFGAERDRMMTGASLAPQLAAQDYADLEARLKAGGLEDAYAQRKLDEANAKYQYDTTAQADWLTQMAQRALGMIPGGTTSGSASSWGMTMPSTDGTPSWLGPALGGLGSVARLLPMMPMMMSDRRLKTDIKQVGRLHDGQKVYSYRFRGEPHHQIGLMAQEVERREPAAVLTDPLGLKHVDYARATRAASARRPGRGRRAIPVGGLM
jgi:Chaperone of endosialidase